MSSFLVSLIRQKAGHKYDGTRHRDGGNSCGISEILSVKLNVIS
ncbi:hypothetical protein [Clostridium bornimense]|nr:hypothetical protein [Clostridium bornimense]